MPRLPFPHPLAVGTDIVHLPRIQRLISKDKDGRSLRSFAHRILHPHELRDLTHRQPEWRNLYHATDADSSSLVRWLGGRFAAKEAARKALGATRLGWKDVRTEFQQDKEQKLEQSRDSSGSYQPSIICTMAQDANREDGLEQEAKLSISHDGEYAIATVLAAPLPVDTLHERLSEHAMRA